MITDQYRREDFLLAAPPGKHTNDKNIFRLQMPLHGWDQRLIPLFEHANNNNKRVVCLLHGVTKFSANPPNRRYEMDVELYRKYEPGERRIQFKHYEQDAIRAEEAGFKPAYLFNDVKLIYPVNEDFSVSKHQYLTDLHDGHEFNKSPRLKIHPNYGSDYVLRRYGDSVKIHALVEWLPIIALADEVIRFEFFGHDFGHL